MDVILNWLYDYEYLAMVGILTLCGVGLPLPEEVTLITSGLLVGWREANFWFATLACAVGILVGDSMIFGLGYYYGQQFLQIKPMQWLLSPARQKKVQGFFAKHGTKALFLARFFPGVRIGVYAYVGSQRLRWSQFFLLDFLGVLISCPTSILVGMWAARAFADDREQAFDAALQRVHHMGYAIIFVIIAVIGIWLLKQFVTHRRAIKP